jgi:hypothetical protein
MAGYIVLTLIGIGILLDIQYNRKQQREIDSLTRRVAWLEKKEIK